MQREKVLHEMEKRGYALNYTNPSRSDVTWTGEADTDRTPMLQRTFIDSDGGDRLIMQCLSKVPAQVGFLVDPCYQSLQKSSLDEKSEYTIVQQVLETAPERNGWYWSRVVCNEPRSYMRNQEIKYFGTYHG